MADQRLNKLGDKIFDLRNQKEITQDALAEKIGVTRQTISKWEANLVQPKLEKLKKICECFDVKLEYFYDNFDNASGDGDKAESVAKIDKEAIAAVACEKVAIDKNPKTLQQKKRTSKEKKAILISCIAVVLAISIVMIIIGLALNITKGNSHIEEVSYRSCNFNVENMGWAMFGIGLSLVMIMCMIIFLHKRKIKFRDN